MAANARAARVRDRANQFLQRSRYPARQPNPLPATEIVPFSDSCNKCHAQFFQNEFVDHEGSKHFCCDIGKIVLDYNDNFPNDLKDLFVGNSPEAVNFRKHQREVNNAFAFGSYHATLKTPPGRGPFSYRIQGQAYRQFSSALPHANQSPAFAQVYFLDSSEAADIRANRRPNSGILPTVFTRIGAILDEVNPHVAAFHHMKEVIEEQDRAAAASNNTPLNVSIKFVTPANVDLRRYNTPTAEEISVVYTADDGEVPAEQRGFVMNARGGGLRRIPEIDPHCQPLMYPLFYPRGQLGWCTSLPKTGTNGEPLYNRAGKLLRISQAEYIRYHTQIRPHFNPLHHGGPLFQQYAVDSWLKIEKERTSYLRQHQSEFFVDTRKGLNDFLASDGQGAVGSRTILPSSFVGGRRYMQQAYLDSLSIVSRYGKPHLFLTMTTNPKWPEITERMEPNMKESDRADIIARVFKLKFDALMKHLLHDDALGKVIAHVAVVEWQKRGLPHAHLLLTLDNDSKIQTATDIDSVISAVIPPEGDELRDIVLSHMIHKPCGQHNPNAICMKDGNCKRGFPKAFANATTARDSGYPTYCRPDDGTTARVGNTVIDNSWVVPHNKCLLKRFNCHLNVEVVSNVAVVRYLYKYITKGPDRARVEIRVGTGPVDEITEYVDCRYVSAPEAMHRLFGFDIQYRSHTIYRLQVHLPGEEPIVFNPSDVRGALERANDRNSNLTAWMRYNSAYLRRRDAGELSPNEPNPLLLIYTDFPDKFVYSANTWRVRQRGGAKTIGRLTTVNPREIERYSLRLLLLHVPGATSYEHLQTFNNIVYPSFRDACHARGLLNDDSMAIRCLEEAEVFQMPSEFRSLFASVFAFCEVKNHQELWDRFVSSLSEDYVHHGLTLDIASAKAFYDIADRLARGNITLSNLITAPTIQRNAIPNTPVNLARHRTLADNLMRQLNGEQRPIVDDVCNTVNQGRQKLAFIDGPAGTGKTFVYTSMYHHLLASGYKVQCCAWTGIAAGLLPEGRTVSSLFQLLIHDDSRSSRMKGQSKEADYLRELDLIIVDEISMISRSTLSAIDRLLRDITGTTAPFGGKCVVVGGDFRQTLPIVKRKGHEGAKDACLKNSDLWRLFERFELTENMRAREDPFWSNFVLAVGNGTAPCDQDSRITFPAEITCGRDIVAATFGPFLNSRHTEELANSAILAPKNVDVNRLNEAALDRMNGAPISFMSNDEILADTEDELRTAQADYPVEFLHALRPAGTPPHHLRLKLGAPIMLLKNLDVSSGLCNGTRLLLRAVGRNVLTCHYANGSRVGQTCFIPKIHCYVDNELPFRLRRTQFPVVLAFCITINKSQGMIFLLMGRFTTFSCCRAHRVT
jgi:hypothetical protein